MSTNVQNDPEQRQNNQKVFQNPDKKTKNDKKRQKAMKKQQTQNDIWHKTTVRRHKEAKQLQRKDRKIQTNVVCVSFSIGSITDACIHGPFSPCLPCLHIILGLTSVESSVSGVSGPSLS